MLTKLNDPDNEILTCCSFLANDRINLLKMSLYLESEIHNKNNIY